MIKGGMMLVFLALLNSVIALYLYILASRVWMQKCRVNYWNPVVQFVVRVTDPLVKPARRLIPGYKGVDFAVIFVIYIFQVALLLTVLPFVEVSLSWWSLAFLALFKAILLVLNFAMYLVILAAVFSWLRPRNPGPFFQLVGELSQPALRRVRSFVPIVRGLDFSPLVLLLVIQLLKFIFIWGGAIIASSLGWVA